MILNIKNARVHDLARQAAAITGKSQTGAIEEALERLLATYGADPRGQRTAAKIDQVRAQVALYVADPGHDAPEITAPDDLYDESTGLPR